MNAERTRAMCGRSLGIRAWQRSRVTRASISKTSSIGRKPLAALLALSILMSQVRQSLKGWEDHRQGHLYKFFPLASNDNNRSEKENFEAARVGVWRDA
jgi:hypothetical protein